MLQAETHVRFRAEIVHSSWLLWQISSPVRECQVYAMAFGDSGKQVLQLAAPSLRGGIEDSCIQWCSYAPAMIVTDREGGSSDTQSSCLFFPPFVLVRDNWCEPSPHIWYISDLEKKVGDPMKGWTYNKSRYDKWLNPRQFLISQCQGVLQITYVYILVHSLTKNSGMYILGSSRAQCTQTLTSLGAGANWLERCRWDWQVTGTFVNYCIRWKATLVEEDVEEELMEEDIGGEKMQENLW